MAGIAATMMIFMMLAIFLPVIMRYLFNRPVAWIVEISSYLRFILPSWTHGFWRGMDVETTSSQAS
jgi:TRAP-type mannitol/chloroaromatic compound transport system permease small subunit